MWAVFFANITAGIAIIGFQSPLFQDLWHRADPTLNAKTLAGYGATLIGVTALFNGLGRFVWGSLSDKIGRRLTFTLMLASQIAVFRALRTWAARGSLRFCCAISFSATAVGLARCPRS